MVRKRATKLNKEKEYNYTPGLPQINKFSITFYECHLIQHDRLGAQILYSQYLHKKSENVDFFNNCASLSPKKHTI